MKKIKDYQNLIEKWQIVLGFCFLCFLGILSLIFYQERTLSFDSAYFSFELIQKKTFFTPLGRWGSVISQILPLSFLKFGCSLKTFLKVYSLSFVLINSLLFLIITTWLKKPNLGIVLILVLCLSVRNTFYFSVSEFAQGLSFVVLILAFLHTLKENERKIHKIILTLLIISISCSLYYFNQLLIIPLILVFAYFIVSNNYYKSFYVWISLLTIILWFGIKLLLLPKNGYEKSKIPNAEIFFNQLPNFFNLKSWNYLVYFFEREFYIFPIIFIGILILLVYKRKILISLLLFTFFISYIILITITYYSGSSENMYEQYFIVFGLPISLGLNECYDKSKQFIIVSLLLIFGGYGIYQSHVIVSKRIEYLKLLTKYGNQYKEKKFVIHTNDFPWGYAWVKWGFPVETILCSSLEGKQNTITCFVVQKNQLVNISANNGQLLGEDWMKEEINVNILDTNFFSLPLNTGYLITNRLNKSLAFTKERIKYDKLWYNNIKQEASLSGVSIEELIEKNAKYIIDITQDEDKINFIVGRDLSYLEIEQEIRNNKEWMEAIQIKAKEKNIAIDNMIRIDAQYILEQRKNNTK